MIIWIPNQNHPSYPTHWTDHIYDQEMLPESGGGIHESGTQGHEDSVPEAGHLGMKTTTNVKELSSITYLEFNHNYISIPPTQN